MNMRNFVEMVIFQLNFGDQLVQTICLSTYQSDNLVEKRRFSRSLCIAKNDPRSELQLNILYV